MGFASVKNIDAWLKSAYAADSTALTAAGTGDNTAVTGSTIDRSTYGYPLSMSVVFALKASLTSSKVLTLTAKVQTGSASDASDMADFLTLATTATVASTTGASTGTAKYAVDLSGAKRYIRVVFTPDLTASGTDTATVTPVAIFGPTAELP